MEDKPNTQPQPRQLSPTVEKLIDLCRRLARLKAGPTQANRAEWIDNVLKMAEEARALVKNQQQ